MPGHSLPLVQGELLEADNADLCVYLKTERGCRKVAVNVQVLFKANIKMQGELLEADNAYFCERCGRKARGRGLWSQGAWRKGNLV